MLRTRVVTTLIIGAISLGSQFHVKKKSVFLLSFEENKNNIIFNFLHDMPQW